MIDKKAPILYGERCVVCAFAPAPLVACCMARGVRRSRRRCNARSTVIASALKVPTRTCRKGRGGERDSSLRNVLAANAGERTRLLVHVRRRLLRCRHARSTKPY